MNTTLLYPVTVPTLPLIKYWHSFFPESDLELSTFLGTGLVDRSAGYAMGYSQPDQTILGEDRLPFLVDRADEIILLPVEESYQKSELTETIIYIKELAVKLQKNVIDYFSFDKTELPYEVFKHPENKLLQGIPMPVIFVGGLSDDAWNEEAFLAILSGLKRGNVPIAAFSDNPLMNLIGCYSLPTADQMRAYTAEQNIKALNDYVFTSALEKQAEAIVFYVSDPILAYNALVTRGFGIAAYELSKAAPPDFIILSLPRNLVEKDIIHGISNECNHSYRQRVNCIAVEDTVLDPINTFRSGKIKKIILGTDWGPPPVPIEDDSYVIPIINLTEGDADCALAQCILKEFGGGDEK